MKQIFTSKILRKFLILSCLVIGLAFVISVDDQKVKAAPCCDECTPNWLSCRDGCAGDPACLNVCNNLRHSCRYNCDPECGGGGSCGMPCGDDGDCFQGAPSVCTFCIQGTCQ